MLEGRLLLINPWQTYEKKLESEYQSYIPYGLACIAAIGESESFITRIVDCLEDETTTEIGDKVRYGKTPAEVEKIIKEFKPDIVGISATFSMFEKDATEVANMVKKIDSSIIIILGGVTATLPEIYISLLHNNDVYQLMSKYYSYADENKAIINELIETVHHHTLSVEMIAKLLEKGLHTPDDVLEHLKENSADPESADKIKISKDGISAKETYYNHIRSLFSLYLLDNDYQSIMRNMIFFEEVRIRYFSKLLDLSDTNRINELCELGFIRNDHADLISLHPMIRDIVLLDLKPSFENCDTLITNLKSKLQIIGYELSDSAIIISCIRNVMKYIGKTDSISYLNFLETAYIFLDNYHEYDFMEIIISETEKLLDDDKLGTDNNRALLLNNKAMLPSNRNDKLAKSISLMNKALSMCDEKSNPVLFANINMNLGILYIENKETERGLEFMDKAYLFIKLCRAYNDDFITIARNYAATLCENMRVNKALDILLECEFATEGCSSNNHAALLFDLGAAYILSKNYPLAVKKYNLAFAEYSALGCTDELTARKIAAAQQLQRYGHEYPKEWKTDYLE